FLCRLIIWFACCPSSHCSLHSPRRRCALPSFPTRRSSDLSLRPILEGNTPEDWQTSMYYRYWEHLSKDHKVGAHYGIRTHRYKLIYYYGESLGAADAIEEYREPEWELYDLENDSYEMSNVYDDSAYEKVIEDLKKELYRLKEEVKDRPDNVR